MYDDLCANAHPDRLGNPRVNGLGGQYDNWLAVYGPIKCHPLLWPPTDKSGYCWRNCLKWARTIGGLYPGLLAWWWCVLGSYLHYNLPARSVSQWVSVLVWVKANGGKLCVDLVLGSVGRLLVRILCSACCCSIIYGHHCNQCTGIGLSWVIVFHVLIGHSLIHGKMCRQTVNYCLVFCSRPVVHVPLCVCVCIIRGHRLDLE